MWYKTVRWTAVTGEEKLKEYGCAHPSVKITKFMLADGCGLNLLKKTGNDYFGEIHQQLEQSRTRFMSFLLPIRTKNKSPVCQYKIMLTVSSLNCVVGVVAGSNFWYFFPHPYLVVVILVLNVTSERSAVVYM